MITEGEIGIFWTDSRRNETKYVIMVDYLATKKEIKALKQKFMRMFQIRQAIVNEIKELEQRINKGEHKNKPASYLDYHAIRELQNILKKVDEK